MNSLSSGYRLFIWPWWKHWLDPRTYYWWLKYKVQRAQRGWADCDIWSLDDYLAGWLPDALLRLKTVKHGIPTQMFEKVDGIDETGNPTDDSMEKAKARWDGALLGMIEGFRAWQRIGDSLYEEELGPYPMCRKKGHFLCDCRDAELMPRLAQIRTFEERDEQVFRRGMALFTEHFGSLWD